MAVRTSSERPPATGISFDSLERILASHGGKVLLETRVREILGAGLIAATR